MWVLARSARTGMVFLEKSEHVGVCKYEKGNRYSVYVALRDHAEDVAQFGSLEEAEDALLKVIEGGIPYVFSKKLGVMVADLRNLEEVVEDA